MIRVAFLALALAGCATTKEPVIVEKPVAVSCLPKELPPAPEYLDADDALRDASDAAERFQRLIAGRQQRMARLAMLEPLVENCR